MGVVGNMAIAVLLVVGGLWLVWRAALARSGEAAFFQKGLLGGGLALLSLLAYPPLLLAAIAFLPNVMSPMGRRHRGSRLMLGAGASAAMAILPLAIALGDLDAKDLLLVATLPLTPFICWWAGSALEQWRLHRQIGPALLMLVGLVLAMLGPRMLMIYPAMGILGWAAWLRTNPLPPQTDGKDGEPDQAGS